MGLDPVRFLVTPRIIAALLMTPLLTLFADLVGLLGGALTMQSFSIPFVTFVHEVEGIVDFTDFMAGFVKSFVFAILDRRHRLPARPADHGGRVGRRRCGDARRGFGHHPARHRRRRVRRHLLRARHLTHA